MSTFASVTGTELPGRRHPTVLECLEFGGSWLRSHPGLVGLYLLVGLLADGPAAIGAGSPAVLATSVAGLALTTLAVGAVHWVGAGEVAGAPVSTTDGLRVSVDRFWSLLGVSLATVLAVGLPALLGVVLLAPAGPLGVIPGLLVGLYVLVRLSLAPAACVIDGIDALEALLGSWASTKGATLTVAGLLLANAVALGGTQFVAAQLSAGAVGPAVVGALVGAVTTPVMLLGLTRVYVATRTQWVLD